MNDKYKSLLYFGLGVAIGLSAYLLVSVLKTNDHCENYLKKQISCSEVVKTKNKENIELPEWIKNDVSERLLQLSKETPCTHHSHTRKIRL